MGLSSLFAALGGMLLLFSTKTVKGSSTSGSVSGSTPSSKYIHRRSNGELWFTEADEFWPGQAQTLKVESVVYEGKSEFQDILLFTSQRFGNVLVLDGAIQYTTTDQSSYQEMMAHTPMHLLPTGSVNKVLVIGGGDGGVLRELAKYPEIKEIHICEIDGKVIEVCKQHLPEAACGYSDPRVIEHVEEGFGFLERMKATGVKFDVIVSDLSDPIGPAGSIYQEDFIKLLSDVLHDEHGVASLQGESFWLHEELIQKLMKKSSAVFPQVSYANIAIPTYPCGNIGMIVMCKNALIKPDIPIRSLDRVTSNLFEYYTLELHKAQFALPKIQALKVYGSEL